MKKPPAARAPASVETRLAPVSDGVRNAPGLPVLDQPQKVSERGRTAQSRSVRSSSWRSRRSADNTAWADPILPPQMAPNVVSPALSK